MDQVSYIHPSPTFGGMSAGLYQNAGRQIDVSDVLSAMPVYLIPVQLRGIPAVNAWRDGKHISLPSAPAGSISCFDMQFQWQVELCFPFRSVHFYIPQKSLDDLSEELRQPLLHELSLSPIEPTIDPFIYHFAQAIAFLMETPSKAPRLLIDQILCALRSHLAFRYGGMALPAKPPTGLSDSQIHRVKSLMLDDLEYDVGLNKLAEVCGLTVHVFRRKFKAMFGRSPHRWRLAQKVERARNLIEFTDTPLAETSAMCGFSDQSHLTRVFTRLVGMPPAAYRRMRRS